MHNPTRKFVSQKVVRENQKFQNCKTIASGDTVSVVNAQSRRVFRVWCSFGWTVRSCPILCLLGKWDTTNQVHFLNGPILSDFMFLEVYWENYINCQMHFFQRSDLIRFLFLFFCAGSGNILPASFNLVY
jgi:hypothetical protein